MGPSLICRSSRKLQDGLMERRVRSGEDWEIVSFHGGHLCDCVNIDFSRVGSLIVDTRRILMLMKPSQLDFDGYDEFQRDDDPISRKDGRN